MLDPARVPELVVLCGLEALADAVAAAGVMSETVDGRAVPIAELRRLACNAHLLPAVLDGAGVVVNLGQRQRLASPDQRLALAAMYLTCGFPGCCVPVRLTEAHHVIDFTRHRGPTDLANLLPHCANATTTSSTKVAGSSNCAPTAACASPAPTVNSTSTAPPSTAATDPRREPPPPERGATSHKYCRDIETRRRA